MSLVAYSSSSSSSDETADDAPPPTKRPRQPPQSAGAKRILLPNTIKHLHFGGNAANEAASDTCLVADPHNGRIRSFAHERGNWATYAYIDCKSVARLCPNRFHALD